MEVSSGMSVGQATGEEGKIGYRDVKRTDNVGTKAPSSRVRQASRREP